MGLLERETMSRDKTNAEKRSSTKKCPSRKNCIIITLNEHLKRVQKTFLDVDFILNLDLVNVECKLKSVSLVAMIQLSFT